MTGVYRRQLPQHQKLGRHVHLDPRSRAYAIQPRDVALRSVRHLAYVGILDQGDVGACTGFAGLNTAYRNPFFLTSWSKTTLTADNAGGLAWYHDNTVIDEYGGVYPPVDTGSSSLATCKTAKSMGVAASYGPALDLATSLAALMDAPGVTGIPWMWEMFEAPSSGLLNVDLDSGLAGGHELCVDEVVLPDAPGNGTGKILVGGPNSWGIDWGDRGRWYMTAADWWTLRQMEGDVYFWTPIDAPAPMPADPIGDALWRDLRVWANAPHIGSNARAAKAVRNWAEYTKRS